MGRIPEPYEQYDAYCREQERTWADRPVCAICGERITSDKCFEDNGEFICEDCTEENLNLANRFLDASFAELLQSIVKDELINTPILEYGY